MSRYIDADELKKLVEEEFKGVCVYDVSPDEAISDFCDVVDNCSSADVAPVVHGHYIKRYLEETGRFDLECSNCKFRIVLDEYDMQYARFCNSCGAKMDESEDTGNE